MIIQGAPIGRHERGICHAVSVLEERCLWRQKAESGVAVRLRGLAPVGTDRVPAVAEPLLVSVAILRDDGSDALRVLCGDPQTNRRAVIEDVDRELFQADDFREAAGDCRQIVERIFEVVAGWHGGLTKAGQVRRHEVKAIGEEGDQIAEHVAGAWKAMQQKQCRRVGRTRLAVEYFEAVDLGRAVSDRGHARLLGAWNVEGRTRPLSRKLGSVEVEAKSRYSADSLPRCDRVAVPRSLVSSARRAKCLRSRGTAKSTKARTFGTESRPCGEITCTGRGGGSSPASTISSSRSCTCSAT